MNQELVNLPLQKAWLYELVKRKVSEFLFNKRVVTLDLASLVAGTKYRGQFEERMKAVMNELKKMMISFYLSMKFIPLLEPVEQRKFRCFQYV